MLKNLKIAKYKKVLLDLTFSFLAYALPTFALQFFIQPGMARVIDGEKYGLSLSILSWLQFLDSSFIGSLASQRLLQEAEEKGTERNEKLNFVFLIVVPILFLTTAMILPIYTQNSKNSFDIVLTLITLGLMCFYDYYSIYFRIKIDFKSIVIGNVLVVIGYLLGYGFFLKYHFWQAIYLTGYLMGSVWIACKTPLWRCPNGRKISKRVMKNYVNLSSAYAMTNSVNYFDRIILYPIMGGMQVSIYNAAMVVSKAISLVTTPLNNVFLSYLVKIKNIKITKKKLLKLAMLIFGGLVLAYIALYFISSFLISLLYGQWKEQAIKYVPVTVAAMLLQNVGTILNNFLLRYESSKIQIVISATRICCYMLFSLIFLYAFGMYGFCLGALVTAIIRTGLISFFVVKRICR